jgi:hypothetical protein
MLIELKQFHAEQGHCRVPAGWAKNPVLANWVGVQRARKLDGKLSPQRIAALDALGFAWRLGEFSGTRSPQEAWNTMLKRLIAFHAENGHAKVPQVYRPDKKLGWWVTTQRQKYRKKKLADWQIERLNELGFDWEGGRKGGRPRTTSPKQPSSEKPLTGEKLFETMFQALLEYKQARGDCLVPQRFKENHKLAEWVSEQRMAYNRERLAPERSRRHAVGRNVSAARRIQKAAWRYQRAATFGQICRTWNLGSESARCKAIQSPNLRRTR